jgi:hypothetical protein
MPVRYITVTPVTNMFKPATRAFGDIAVVGAADAGSTGPMKVPVPVTNPEAVSHSSNPGGADQPVDSAAWFGGALGDSIRVCLEQSPGPSKVYAVRTDPADGDDALANALAEVAKLTVQIVTLAATPLTSTGGTDEIEALAGHVNSVSSNGADGKERIGVAMLGKGVTDPALVTGGMSLDRMVMVAHHSDEDAAAAVAGTIAGYEPHISLLLKPVALSVDAQFSDSEIDAFNGARINWLTDPALLPGRGLFLGEGYTLGSEMPYIDIPRTIDDITFRLKARLIRSIGRLRVSRSGIRALVSQMIAILEPLRQREVIEGYDVFFPLLTLLDKDPSTLTDAELQQINNAQNDRTVSGVVAVDYAGAIHRLELTLLFQ